MACFGCERFDREHSRLSNQLDQLAGMVAQVVGSDDEDAEGGEADGDAAAGQALNTDMDLGAEGDRDALNVNQIDAYWLQRQIAEAYAKTDEPLDPAVAQVRSVSDGSPSRLCR